MRLPGMKMGQEKISYLFNLWIMFKHKNYGCGHKIREKSWIHDKISSLDYIISPAVFTQPIRHLTSSKIELQTLDLPLSYRSVHSKFSNHGNRANYMSKTASPLVDI